jgi:hypothetical protein
MKKIDNTRIISKYSLLVVACSYRLNPDEMIKKIAKLDKKFNINLSGVIVSNGPHELESNDKNWSIIKGTNADYDFSAYFEGANFLSRNQNLNNSTIIFLNDSFFTSHDTYGQFGLLLNLIPLVVRVNSPAIIGRISHYHSICFKNPWSGLNLFVPTYCFALNIEGIRVLLDLNKFAYNDGLTNENQVIDDNWGGKLNLQFFEYLRSVVIIKESPYFWKQFGIYPPSKTLLYKKARCVYFEHRLSGELAKDGCIIPINSGVVRFLYVLVRDFIASLTKKTIAKIIVKK